MYKLHVKHVFLVSTRNKIKFLDKEFRSSSNKVHWLAGEVCLGRSYYIGLKSVVGTVMIRKGIERNLPWSNRDTP